MTKPCEVIILGSGTSTGVPVIGCNCHICTSTKRHYHRLRSSIAIKDSKGDIILVDAGPDIRQQILNNKLHDIKHILLTHTHADHCHGFDDLRVFCFKSKEPLNLYATSTHLQEFTSRFNYLFDENGYEGVKPQVERHTLKNRTFSVLGHDFEFQSLDHGHTLSSAFKFKNFAYATDFKRFSKDQIALWRGKIHTMVASGIRFRAHHSHSSIQETVDLFSQLDVKQGIITHLSHEVDADLDRVKVPDWVTFAYDGMRIKI